MPKRERQEVATVFPVLVPFQLTDEQCACASFEQRHAQRAYS
jgi:hypothetical protein